MNDYDKLRELAEAATPGPWVATPVGYQGWRFDGGYNGTIKALDGSYIYNGPAAFRALGGETEEAADANAAFIAAARDAVPALLDERNHLLEDIAVRSLEWSVVVEDAEAKLAAVTADRDRLLNPTQRDTYRCQRCNVKYGMDASLPNSQWAAISDGQWDVLCLWCIDALAAEKGVKYEAYLYFNGVAGGSALYNSDNDPRWVELLNEARADRDRLAAEVVRLEAQCFSLDARVCPNLGVDDLGKYCAAEPLERKLASQNNLVLRLAAENVALREALRWTVDRYEIAGHQNDNLLQRRLMGTSDPDTMAFLNGVIAARSALAGPSPAVAEIERLAALGRLIERLVKVGQQTEKGETQ